MARTGWKRILLRADARLELDGGDPGRDILFLGKEMEVLARKRLASWLIPLNNRRYWVYYADIVGAGHFFIQTTESEANDQNSMLVNCRDCGRELTVADVGFGTEQGHCEECLTKEER